MIIGSIIGYDLNDFACQISYYNKELHEPETVESATNNYQIPLIIGMKNNSWVVGRDAKRLSTIKEGLTIEHLLSKSKSSEKIQVGDIVYDAVWLLSKFIESSLRQFEKIETIVFCLPEINEDIAHMLKGIGQHIGIEKEKIYIQDYKESFCNYMFYQPKELWQYEAALFYCDKKEVKAYMLKKLKTSGAKGQSTFVTVDAVADARMEELAFVYPVVDGDAAIKADERFKMLVESVFDKKIVSSVFLTGEGFENNWYPNSLRVLCNGRRAFLGNNLYSKGACYRAYRESRERLEGPTYLDENKFTQQICMKMRINGQEEWFPIVTWGSHWYESDKKWEVLLEDTEDIEFHVESLSQRDLEVHRISLEGLPERASYSMRMQVETIFLDKNTCKIIMKDIGFGEFFPATDFQTEKIIQLGGTNGQFNSLS